MLKKFKIVISLILALTMLVSLPAVSAFAVDSSLKAADGSKLRIWDDFGYITGATPETAPEEFLTQLTSSNYDISIDCSSKYVGTGTVINLAAEDSSIIKSYTVVLYGDVNCDGKVDFYDVASSIDVKTSYSAMLNKYEGHSESDLTKEVLIAADCNHDGLINKIDRDIVDDYYYDEDIDQTAKPIINPVITIYRDDLKAAIDAYNETDLSTYSTIGVKNALKCYNNAVAVYNNPDAGQKLVDNAKSELTASINIAKTVSKTKEPLMGVFGVDIKVTDNIGDSSYFKWDQNLGILTLYPGSSGEILVPPSNVVDLPLRPRLTPWRNSIFVKTIVVTAPVGTYPDNNYLHSLYNLESIVFTDPNTKVYSDFIKNCENADGKTITVYGCNDNHKARADAWGFDYKSVDEYSVSTEPDSAVTLDSESKTLTGVNAGKSASDFLTQDVAIGGNCYVELESDVVGTGAKLLAKSVIDGSTIDEYDVVIYGDVDGDGLYDATDAYKVNLIINGWLTREQVGEAAWAAADCNHDGVIDSLDAEL
ncbi:MAG: dockerin type I domain-containing protein, partial [Acutalibacteraceae bacterium]